MVFPDRVDYYYNTGKRIIQTKEQGLKDLLAGERIEPALYNKLYKRELFENVRLNENLKINEDLDVNYRLFKKKSEINLLRSAIIFLHDSKKFSNRIKHCDSKK